MNPSEGNIGKPDSDVSIEEDIEKKFPPRDEDRRAVTEGALVDLPEWCKRAILLASRVEEAALYAQKLREALAGLSRRVRDKLPSGDLAEWTVDDVAMQDDAKCYQRYGVETCIATILLCFDFEAAKIENQLCEICYTPQALAGQPLSPMLARFLEYRNEYRAYLEGAIREGRSDRVKERTLRSQWMSHTRLIGMTANEVGERLDIAQKRRRGRTRKFTAEEANIKVRELLKKTLSWDWTVRKLAAKLGCSAGLISKCPAWKAYKERRDQCQKEGTIKTVSLSKEMEAVLGTGDRDETLNQLIAEQEEVQQGDERQARLYPSHDKKARRRES